MKTISILITILFFNTLLSQPNHLFEGIEVEKGDTVVLSRRVVTPFKIRYYETIYTNNSINYTVYDKKFKTIEHTWYKISDRNILGDKQEFKLEAKEGIYHVFLHSSDTTLVPFIEEINSKIK